MIRQCGGQNTFCGIAPPAVVRRAMGKIGQMEYWSDRIYFDPTVYGWKLSELEREAIRKLANWPTADGEA